MEIFKFFIIFYNLNKENYILMLWSDRLAMLPYGLYSILPYYLQTF